MWRSLFWKEWREQRWKAAFNTLLVTAFVAVGLRARVMSDMAILVFTGMLNAMILPLFVSMGLFAAERAEGSTRFLFALPSKSSQLYIVKVLVGILIVLLPHLGAILSMVLIAGNREIAFTQIVSQYSGVVLVSLQAFIWFLVFGIGQPNEARAGLASALTYCVWAFIVLLLIIFNPGQGINLVWGLVLFTPFGFLFWEISYTALVVLILQVFIIIGLCLWGYLRFSTERGINR